MKIIIKNDLTGQTKTAIVEDKFKSLSAKLQNETVNEIAEKIDWSKEPQVQEQKIQELVQEPSLSRGQSVIRTLMETTFPSLGLTRDKDIKEEARNIGELLSYYPTPRSLTAKAAAIGSKAPILSKGTEFVAKTAAETVPQAALGGTETYLREREKGAYKDEAAKTAGISGLIEAGLGGVIGLTGDLGKTVGKKITQNIPDDLYQKAKKFSKDTAVSVENRIKQIIDLGKKALKDNKNIAINANKEAINAANKNKNIAQSLANDMRNLGEEFYKKNTPKGKISLIKNISEQDLSNAIQTEYDKLLLRAKPLIEDGGISRNKEAEELLKDFKNRFMTTKKVRVEKLVPDPVGYGLTKKETIEEIVEPIKDRKKFFREMRLITDSSTWGEGKSAIKQSYARVHDSLNNFLKDNSLQYREHKKLGQDLVNFSDYKVDIVDEYDANKLQNALKNSLSTFEKQPDLTSSKTIERVLDQANRRLGTKYKTEDIIKKFEINEQQKLLKNKGKLSDEQLSILGERNKQIYEENKDLGKVTEKGFFKPKKGLEEFLEDPANTRLAELLPPELVEQIEIEQAGRFFRRPYDINIPFGTIATPTVRALQATKQLLRLPRTQVGIKRFLEGDLPITPEALGLTAQTLGRAVPREAFRSDEQKVDVDVDERNRARFTKRQPNPEYERNQSGEYKNQIKMKKDRGIIK